MRKLISTICLTVAMAIAVSCDDDDYDTHFSDISIEDPVSVWAVDGDDFWGLKMSGDYVREFNFSTDYYLSFGEGGKGVFYTGTYKYDGYEGTVTFDSTFFSYKTDDARHFDITTEKGEERSITFAKESFWGSGRRESNCVIYWATTESGRTIYHWHRCEEMRTDTALLQKRGMRKGMLTVPKARVWQGKTLIGEFDNQTNDAEYRTLEFRSNGSFIFNKGCAGYAHNPEYKGEYTITTGAADSIFFTFSDGRKEEYNIIFDRTGGFLYKDGKLTIRLKDRHYDSGY